MDTQTLSPENTEERIIWHSIRLTYVFYLFGALYVLAPVLGWSLLLVVIARWLRGQPLDPRIGHQPLPLAIWLWIIGSFTAAFAISLAAIALPMRFGEKRLSDRLI